MGAEKDRSKVIVKSVILRLLLNLPERSETVRQETHLCGTET